MELNLLWMDEDVQMFPDIQNGVCILILQIEEFKLLDRSSNPHRNLFFCDLYLFLLLDSHLDPSLVLIMVKAWLRPLTIFHIYLFLPNLWCGKFSL